MTTHGTPASYDAGCHGAAECTNHKTGLMTCAEAHIRYQHDYQYRKAVESGTATTEREQFAKEKRPSRRVVVETKAERAARPKAVKVVKEPRPPAKRVRKMPKQQKHGTSYNARYCKAECPNEAAGGISCRQAHREYQNAYLARIRAGNGPPPKHGTRYSYQAGCQDRATCPMPAGETCPDVQTNYGRAHYAAAA